MTKINIKDIFLACVLIAIFVFFRGWVGVLIALVLCTHLFVNTDYFKTVSNSRLDVGFGILFFGGSLCFFIFIPFNQLIMENVFFQNLSELPYAKSPLDKAISALVVPDSKYKYLLQVMDESRRFKQSINNNLGALQISSFFGYLGFAFMLPLVCRRRVGKPIEKDKKLPDDLFIGFICLLWLVGCMAMLSINYFIPYGRRGGLTAILTPHAWLMMILVIAYGVIGFEYFSRHKLRERREHRQKMRENEF